MNEQLGLATAGSFSRIAQSINSKLLYSPTVAMKLISNKALREFAALHPDADQPVQDFRRLIEFGNFSNFAALKGTFSSVDKVGEKYVFNIGGNKYRLVAAIAYQPGLVWVKAVLTHGEYDKGAWK
jgi:mRNA interferase HigB